MATDGVRAVRFKRNFGQHAAMHAGLVRARGEILVTMDGDLQNAPEDLPCSLPRSRRAPTSRAARAPLGGTRGAGRCPRSDQRDASALHQASDISDFGCAFNAYRRSAIEPMLGAIGKQKFTKALVLSGGASVVEVDVAHSPRAGRSRYSPLRLTRLALHVLAGFWPQPIQWIGIALGVLCTFAALVLGVYGVFYWIDRANFPGRSSVGSVAAVRSPPITMLCWQRRSTGAAPRRSLLARTQFCLAPRARGAREAHFSAGGAAGWSIHPASRPGFASRGCNRIRAEFPSGALHGKRRTMPAASQ